MSDRSLNAALGLHDRAKHITKQRDAAIDAFWMLVNVANDGGWHGLFDRDRDLREILTVEQIEVLTAAWEGRSG